MTHLFRNIAPLLAAVAITLFAGYPAHAEEVNESGWFVPDVKAYGLELPAFTTEKDLVSRCPGREHVQTLWMVNGFRFPDEARAKYGIKSGDDLVLVAVNTLQGKVSSMFIDTDLKYPMEITLVDPEGDGVFSDLYGPDEKHIDTPDWILKLCGSTP